MKNSEIVYNGYFKVRKDQIESVILETDAAIILAQDKEGRWILNREYRHATGQTLLGCPGGRLEPNEDPISAGRRELLEETGYIAEDIQIMGSSYPFPGICNQKIYYLFAKGAVKQGKQNLDPMEKITVVVLSDAELKKEIKESSQIDAIMLTALWYRDHL